MTDFWNMGVFDELERRKRKDSFREDLRKTRETKSKYGEPDRKRRVCNLKKQMQIKQRSTEIDTVVMSGMTLLKFCEGHVRACFNYLKLMTSIHFVNIWLFPKVVKYMRINIPLCCVHASVFVGPQWAIPNFHHVCGKYAQL